MTLRRWTRISTMVVHQNPWWRYRKDTFEIEPGKRGEYHYASTPGSALVVPVTADGKLVVVEQSLPHPRTAISTSAKPSWQG